MHFVIVYGPTKRGVNSLFTRRFELHIAGGKENFITNLEENYRASFVVIGFLRILGGLHACFALILALDVVGRSLRPSVSLPKRVEFKRVMFWPANTLIVYISLSPSRRLSMA